MNFKRQVLALAAGLLVSVSFAGCTEYDGPSQQEIREQHYKNHNLLLHPPVYEWNNTNKEFSGYVILTNRFPDPTDEDKWINVSNMDIRAQYWSGGQTVETVDDYNAGWTLDYDSFQILTIKPGESMIFNFSYPPYNRHRDESVEEPIDRIKLTIHYNYFYVNRTHIKEVSNPNGYFSHSASYTNECLYIVDGAIQQRIGDDVECNPWIIDYKQPYFKLRIEDLRAFPPPELWPEWDNDSPISLKYQPWFRDDVEFLRDFRLEEANVVYFNGEIDY